MTFTNFEVGDAVVCRYTVYNMPQKSEPQSVFIPYPESWDLPITHPARLDAIPHMLDGISTHQGIYADKCYNKEMVNVPNRANKLHGYILQYWPQIANEQGVWVVGSTAYLLADNREPTGDLDLVCKDQATVEKISRLLAPTDMATRTYLGGERVYSGGKQVDVWALNPGQSIDDMILGFSNTHPQARVAYEIATGKLIVYTNVNAL